MPVHMGQIPPAPSGETLSDDAIYESGSAPMLEAPELIYLSVRQREKKALVTGSERHWCNSQLDSQV